MSRFRRLSHSIWYCHYHIVWVPKYRFRILRGEIKIEIEEIIRMYSAKLGCEVDKLSIQEDHVHLLVMVSPKVSLSEYIGTIKGRSAIRLFSRFPWLRQKPYWGNHFWARGYCLDTVGLDVEKIRKYVMYQEKIEKQLEIRG
ncbi:MAG: IS200/IS605 family transposase [Candidatus Babeliales bacterium]